MAAVAAEDIIDGRFRIIREIGRGGMGAVYVVEHLLTGHTRALKLLDAETEDNVRRIVREASAASRIRSPHVVETLDAGLLQDGGAYILMELLEGESLAETSRRLGPVSVSLACELGAQACVGLEAAHRAGVIHRDVKPANLFLTGTDAAPFLKIIDFGISHFDARITEMTEMTREGVAIGTPNYMAPEQLRGDRSIDGRADVYALAIVIYTLLGGRRPYATSSIAELAIAVDRGNYEPLDRLRPDLPPRLVRTIHTAMSPDPQARPDAATFGRQLAARGEADVTPPAASLDTVSVVVPAKTLHPQEPRVASTKGGAPRALLVSVAIVVVLFAVVVGVALRQRVAHRDGSAASSTGAGLVSSPPPPAATSLPLPETSTTATEEPRPVLPETAPLPSATAVRSAIPIKPATAPSSLDRRNPYRP